MAKLGVAYGLCPLIDNSSLMGVNVDALQDCVIVTIGRNIVIRYKFQDQKQVSSWSSKDKLTSAVVYNSSTSEYTAIFNHDQLRMWKEDDQLDKVKKFKFQEPLHAVISDPEGNSAYILYRCGYVTSLTHALESRKDSVNNPILKNSDIIKDQALVTCNGVKYIAFTSSSEKDEVFLNVVPVLSGVLAGKYPVVWKGCSKNLVGHTVISSESSCDLLSLWSDGSLCSFRFLPDVCDDDFPGTLLQKVTSVSCKNPVAIIPISSSHFAFFGADSSEEGASLILLNLQFQLIQSRLHFKLYTKPPRLWNVGGHLLVAVGNNLVAVPYHLQVEHLSNLVGTHTASLHMSETFWSNIEDVSPIDDNVPNNLGMRMKSLREEGWSQAAILQNVLPDLLKERDVESLLWCLQNISDIPENSVVEIMKFCFSQSHSAVDASETTVNMKTSENRLSNCKVNSKELRNSALSEECEKHSALIDAVLNVPVSDVCIMPHLRGVPFTTILALLTHLSDLIEQENTVSPVRVIEWLCLVLDSHYQEYLLSHNEEVCSILMKLSDKVTSQIEGVEELKKLMPLLSRLHSGKIPLKISEISDRKYTVENLQLY